MITLSKKLKEAQQKGNRNETSAKSIKPAVSSIRDQLLVKELADAGSWKGCELTFPDANVLHNFTICVRPDEGMWKDGSFVFMVSIPEEYNMKPPVVKCKTSVWHPNISMAGDVCLSILREHSLDGSGWAPTRSLKDLVWGLSSLFTDLVDFDDPLNIDAAEEYRNNPRQFRRTLELHLYKNLPS
uniref:E2 NEDD8-conjugating enzyme n=1 Tax=Ciona savignyi TaxID=51511 RepID=H2YQW8_CIOSA